MSAYKLFSSICTSFLLVAHLSCLLPARYFHPRCSLGLTLFEYLSRCYRVGSLGNKMQIPVSFGARCTALHSLMRRPVHCVACKMTTVLNFNIKVYGRSLWIFFDLCVCWRIVWRCAMERQTKKSWSIAFKIAQLFLKKQIMMNGHPDSFYWQRHRQGNKAFWMKCKFLSISHSYIQDVIIL